MKELINSRNIENEEKYFLVINRRGTSDICVAITEEFTFFSVGGAWEVFKPASTPARWNGPFPTSGLFIQIEEILLIIIIEYYNKNKKLLIVLIGKFY